MIPELLLIKYINSIMTWFSNIKPGISITHPNQQQPKKKKKNPSKYVKEVSGGQNSLREGMNL